MVIRLAHDRAIHSLTYSRTDRMLIPLKRRLLLDQKGISRNAPEFGPGKCGVGVLPTYPLHHSK
jgi:hypothetical protein